LNRHAFTTKFTGISRVLTTVIGVIKSGETNLIQVNSIWDTGASGSVITKAVAAQLGLAPTGMAQVSTANGMALQNTYTIDIMLPNRLVVQKIVATEVDSLAGGCGALIGMDIINLGDFSVTNHKGVTCMSFRIPSSHEIDYVASPDYGIVKVATMGKERGWEGKFRNNKKK